MSRAKGLGGCGLHNAMVYVRGGKSSYDDWERIGCTGWNYENVLPFFERLESKVEITTAEMNEFSNAVSASCQNHNIPFREDYNQTGDEPCVSPFQYLIKHGRRETAYSAYLKEVPENIKVLTGSLVSQILVKQGKADGVEYFNLSDRVVTRVKATSEIVLCAGSIGSPQILMLSGIGPADHLKSRSIRTVMDLPGVGQNFQDDIFVTVGFASLKDVPPQPYGLLGVVIFCQSSGRPGNITDIECSLASGQMTGISIPSRQHRSYFIYPNIQSLHSRGTVRLLSASPLEHPLIDPRYLSDPRDMKRCVWAVKFAREIGRNRAMGDWYSHELQPGKNVRSDQEIEAYVRSTAMTCYHYSGTCRMGTGNHSVVDPFLKVNGIENLRVIDASIIPRTVSGNTAAATMMIAERGSQFIADGL